MAGPHTYSASLTYALVSISSKSPKAGTVVAPSSVGTIGKLVAVVMSSFTFIDICRER